MQKAVGIKFNNQGKVYHFAPGNNKLNIGDEVVVDTVNGLSIGTVATEIFDKEDDSELKEVVRLVTFKDREKMKEYQKKAKEDTPVIIGLIKDLGLVMKVSTVEYAFDGSKLTICFTADGRVDFRELLKQLASRFKTRIELRQIGARDEVKAVGGMGACGNECCCIRFGFDTDHVTVKMAKNQGLSLNPTKINGLCGRLMCCLSYENDTYTEILSRMPKVGASVKTNDGEGVVVYNDLLKEKVQVKFTRGDSFELKTYDLSEITFDNQNKKEDNNNKKGE